MAASSPTVLLTRARTGGIAVVILTSSRVNSPPWGVGDREPPGNDDHAEVVVTRIEGLSINDLESVHSRIGLEATEMSMHVLPVGGSILQGNLNRLRSHKGRGHVHNHSVADLVSTVYIPSMGSLEVGVNRREELGHRHIQVMLISVRICQQEP